MKIVIAPDSFKESLSALENAALFMQLTARNIAAVLQWKLPFDSTPSS